MRFRAGLLPLIGILASVGMTVGLLTWIMDGTAEAAIPEPAYVGIRFTPLDPVGVRVDEVAANSPAARVGIQPGDIIYTLDGSYVNGDALLTRVARYQPSDEVVLGIQRNGVEHHMMLRLGPLPDQTDNQLELMSLSTASDSFHVSGVVYGHDDQAWHVRQLEPSDTLAASGLQEGDVITHINAHTLTQQTRDVLMLATMVEDVAELTVLRDQHEIQIEVPAVLARMLLVDAQPMDIPLE
jgi:S1-C subfamily serine protease